MLLSKLNSIDLESMSPTNRLIAEYIKANPSEARVISSSAIAKKLNIAQSSVSRFATDCMEYSNFKDMQLDILPESSTEETEEIQFKDDIDDIKRKIMYQYKNMAQLTSDLNNSENIRKAVDIILSSNQIICVGMGNSGLYSEYLNNRLIRLGFNSFYSTNLDVTKTVIANSDRNCSIIVMSETGKTPEILEIIKIAHDLNNPIICMTRYAQNPLASLATVSLFTFNGTLNFNLQYITMRCSQLYIIDVIFFYIISLNPDKYFMHIEQTKRE